MYSPQFVLKGFAARIRSLIASNVDCWLQAIAVKNQELVPNKKNKLIVFVAHLV